MDKKYQVEVGCTCEKGNYPCFYCRGLDMEEIKRIDEEIPIKWKPKEGQEYWYVSSDGSVSLMRWRDNALCNFYFEFGNCFSTKQAASVNKLESTRILTLEPGEIGVKVTRKEAEADFLGALLNIQSQLKAAIGGEDER